MDVNLEKLFFDAIMEAIQEEECELNRLFEQNSDFYKTVHHGVWQLYETSFVYAGIKNLLRRKFPQEVCWECPYPSNKNLHADMGLRGVAGEVSDIIEVKLWLEDKADKIKRDIDKLRSEACGKYMMVINFGGFDIAEVTEHVKFLTNTITGIQLVQEKSFLSKTYLKEHAMRSVDVMMFKVN